MRTAASRATSKWTMTLPLVPPKSVRVCAVAAAFALGGCEERVPSVNVLGAFFPAWMLCILAGIALTILARQLLTATGLDPWIGPRALVYPALALVFMLLTWLAFFQS